MRKRLFVRSEWENPDDQCSAEMLAIGRLLDKLKRNNGVLRFLSDLDGISPKTASAKFIVDEIKNIRCWQRVTVEALVSRCAYVEEQGDARDYLQQCLAMSREEQLRLSARIQHVQTEPTQLERELNWEREAFERELIEMPVREQIAALQAARFAISRLKVGLDSYGPLTHERLIGHDWIGEAMPEAGDLLMYFILHLQGRARLLRKGRAI